MLTRRREKRIKSSNTLSTLVHKQHTYVTYSFPPYSHPHSSSFVVSSLILIILLLANRNDESQRRWLWWWWRRWWTKDERGGHGWWRWKIISDSVKKIIRLREWHLPPLWWARAALDFDVRVKFIVRPRFCVFESTNWWISLFCYVPFIQLDCLVFMPVVKWISNSHSQLVFFSLTYTLSCWLAWKYQSLSNSYTKIERKFARQILGVSGFSRHQITKPIFTCTFFRFVIHVSKFSSVLSYKVFLCVYEMSKFFIVWPEEWDRP